MVQKVTVAICYEPPLVKHGADLQDILEQVNFVRQYLSTAGYLTRDIVYRDDPLSFLQEINNLRPDVIWNLFETFEGAEEKQNLGIAMLELTGVPYTGNKLNPITICIDKRTVKALLSLADIPTPGTYSLFHPGKWIFKPGKLHGSVGITEKSVADITSEEQLLSELAKYPKELEIFAEQYIDGREFSAAMLDMGNGLKTVAVSEMLFSDSWSDSPKILNFNSKWAKESAEYKNSVRSFNFTPEDIPMLKNMRNMAEKIAAHLGLSGFARIDFRVGADNKIWVIDVNMNPCMGEDAGFIAACKYAGITPEQAVSNIVLAAYN